MEHINKAKAGVVAAFGTLSGWLGILAVPIVLLVAANLIDYVTGIRAAVYRGEAVNSDKGFRGIWKKVCMWVLVGVGAGVDHLIQYTTEAIGIHIPVAFFMASVVAVWLICNEMISILENVADIGVPVPAFLLKIVEKIKGATEEQAEEKAEEKTEEDATNEANLD